MQRPVCLACDSRKAAFLCESCINAQLFEDDARRELLDRRDELQHQLEAALEKQVRPLPR